MKKVKVIEKVDTIEEAIKITDDIEECELIKTEKCKQNITRDKDKIYLVTEINDIFDETGEYSKMNAKKILTIGSYLLESRNKYTGDKSYVSMAENEVVEFDIELERLNNLKESDNNDKRQTT